MILVVISHNRTCPKIPFQRPRPTNEPTLIEVSGWSFPSGHAMNSVIFYGMIAYLPARHIHSWGLRVGVIACSLSIAFCASDVMAGCAGGLVWLCICITGIEMNQKRREIDNAGS